MNRSHKSSHYGALAEQVAIERYPLEIDHAAHHDAVDDDGRPWEIKSTMITRRSPRFRLWADQHQYLTRENGGYVFVAYKPVGRGIRPVKIRTVSAADMDLNFYGSGDHQKGHQYKMDPTQVLA